MLFLDDIVICQQYNNTVVKTTVYLRFFPRNYELILSKMIRVGSNSEMVFLQNTNALTAFNHYVLQNGIFRGIVADGMRIDQKFQSSEEAN